MAEAAGGAGRPLQAEAKQSRLQLPIRVRKSRIGDRQSSKESLARAWRSWEAEPDLLTSHATWSSRSSAQTMPGSMPGSKEAPTPSSASCQPPSQAEPSATGPRDGANDAAAMAQAASARTPRSPRRIPTERGKTMMGRHSMNRILFVRRPRALMTPPPEPTTSPPAGKPFRWRRICDDRLGDAAEAVGRDVVCDILKRFAGSPLPCDTPLVTPPATPLAAAARSASPTRRPFQPPRPALWDHAPLWCGRCSDEVVAESRTLHPSSIILEGQKNLPRLTRVPLSKGGESDCESDSDASSLDTEQPGIPRSVRRSLGQHFGLSCGFQPRLEDIEIPEPPERSAFSREPHPVLTFLPAATVARLDLRTLQQRVKLPKLQELVAAEFARSDTGGRQTPGKATEAMRSDLRIAAVRMVVSKPQGERDARDVEILEGFLRKSALFESLKPELLKEVAAEIRLRHFKSGDVVCKEQQRLGGVYLVLRGTATARAGSYAVHADRATNDGEEAVRGPGSLIGHQEVLTHGGVLCPSAWGDCPSIWTAFATAPLESLFLSAEAAAQALARCALAEKLEAILLFPVAKKCSQAELMDKSKVVRKGDKVPLHALFEVMEFPRHHIFYRAGGKLPPDQALVGLVMAGSVRLKEEKGDRRETFLEAGTMFGEEPLRGQPYEATAQVVSKHASVLLITAADYIAQFLGGRPRPPVQQPPAEPQGRRPPSPRSARAQPAACLRELDAATRRQASQRADRRGLLAELGPRRPAARAPPAAARAASPRSARERR